MNDLKRHFKKQKQKMQIHLEQLRIIHRRLQAKAENTLKVERQIAFEESRLALLEDLWDVQ